MPDPHRKINFRLPPDPIEAGRDWAEDAGTSLTGLIEHTPREPLGISRESVDYRLADLGYRIENLKRLAEREGAV